MRRLTFHLALVLLAASCGGENPTAPGGPAAMPAPAAGVILEGTVRRFTTDQLLEGVTVRADQDVVISSGRGGYSFTSLGEGEVWIRATYPGFLPYSARQRLRPGRNRHDIDLVPERQR